MTISIFNYSHSWMYVIMAQSTLTYILDYIRQNIPSELLELAFKPRKFGTNLEQRIIEEIVEGPVLLDTNLVCGKRREIFMSQNWLMDINDASPQIMLGAGVQGSFYKVPPEYREGRNIASVIGMTTSLASSMPASNMGAGASGSFGNTATGMLSAMINTRTMGEYPFTPQVTLEGTNIIRMFPMQMVDGCAVTVMLEFDSEYLNINNSAILSLRELCLVATYRYIATKLRVSIDETEIVGGMELGIIKTLVEEYAEKAKEYQTFLTKFKGSAHFDKRSLSKIIYYAL